MPPAISVKLGQENRWSIDNLSATLAHDKITSNSLAKFKGIAVWDVRFGDKWLRWEKLLKFL